ncbi:hypothetical protein D9M71_668300 [compost metagenome]
MNSQLQRLGLLGKGAQLLGTHLRQAVVLTVEHMQAQALQFVAIGKVEEVEGRQATMGEVGQQGVGMGEQANLIEAF